MNKSIFIIFLMLVLIPAVSSLEELEPTQQNELRDIRVTPLANGSIDSVTANITIKDPDGLVLVGFEVMQKNTDSQDFNFTLLGSNTSKLGFYECTIYAFSNIAANEGFSCGFEVNPSGKSYIPEITGPLIFGAILTLMFISGLLLVLGWRIDLFPMKVFLIIMSGIVAIMNIGFVTGSFQEFFSTSSSLSGAFGTLYITFVMLITAASLFLLIWIVLAGFKVYRVKRGFFVDPE